MLLLLLVCLVSFGNPTCASPRPEPQGWWTSLFGGEVLEPTGDNLYEAIVEGDLDTVKDLVERGADIDYSYGAPLERAARDGHTEIVRYLLGMGANPNGTNEYEHSYGRVLEYAAGNNQLEIMDMLLEAGASVATEKYGNGILDRAAENGHLEAVQKLLDAGADPNHSQAYSLLLAAKNGHLDVVKAYIAAGVNVNEGSGWVIYTAAEEGHLEIVKTLMEAPGYNNTFINYALQTASSTGKLDVVNFLISKGADPSDSSALKSASEKGYLEVVRALLEAGATITYDKESGSPLHYAVLGGHPDVVALLVEYGADINRALKKDFWWDVFTPYDADYGNGWTVMHTTARFGYPMIKELIDLGADIDLQDAKGRTPLQISIFYENPEVTKELLKYCADASIQNNKDNYCKAFDDQGVISLGMEYVAKCTCVIGRGPRMTVTPLQEANLCSTP